MEEQEKIDIREHLIGWIDSFLEDGIIPQVVNPKAIRANYILKSKIKEKIEELDKRYKEIESKYTEEEIDAGDENLDDYVEMQSIQKADEVLQELMEDK